MEIKNIKAEDLLKDTSKKLRDTDEETVKKLVRDIRERGQVQAVTARVVNENVIQLIDGWHRTEACKLTGVHVLTQLVEATDDQADALAVACNTHRKEFTGLDRLNALLRLKESGLSVAKAAPALGISESRFYEMQRISNYPELVEALKTNKLGLEQCVVIAKALSAKKIELPIEVAAVVVEVKNFGRVPSHETCLDLIDQVNGKAKSRKQRRQRDKDREKQTYIFVFDNRTSKRELLKKLGEAEGVVARLRAMIETADKKDIKDPG